MNSTVTTFPDFKIKMPTIIKSGNRREKRTITIKAFKIKTPFGDWLKLKTNEKKNPKKKTKNRFECGV